MRQHFLLRYTALLLIAALSRQALGACPPSTKFIELDWDIPSSAELRNHWRDMERTAPFDGVMFRVETQDEQGSWLSSEAIWDARPWKRDWLPPAHDFRRPAFPRPTAIRRPTANKPGWRCQGNIRERRISPGGRTRICLPAVMRWPSGSRPRARGDTPVTRLDVFNFWLSQEGKSGTYAERTLRAKDLARAGGYADYWLDFEHGRTGKVEYRVWWPGRSPLSLDRVVVVRKP